ILELMTHAHGRHVGLVRGGAGSRLRPGLQPGKRVGCTWGARLDEHLGHYAVELLDARAAALLPVAHALYGMTHLAALCRLLPERDPHPQIHAALAQMLDGLLDPRCAAPGMVRFELKLLAELGFGLDLSACAASGVETDLVYVSPKSGRAVSRQAGGAESRPISSMCGQNPDARSRGRRANLGATGCSHCRHFCARPPRTSLRRR